MARHPFPPAPASGGWHDGDPAAFRSFADIGPLRLVGRQPGLAEGDVRGVEVLAGHLGGLRGALGLGADLREADLDLGDRELRGLLGRLRLGDVVFGWGRLGHLGDRERRYGRQRRESEADPASLLGKCLH